MMRDLSKIPAFACKPGCSLCCGVVPFTDAERDAMAERFPLLAWVPREDGWLLQGALEDSTCPLRRPSGCMAYDIRPGLCRLFQSVDDPRMTCPESCGPERKLSNREAAEAMGWARAAGSVH
ncbi:YkgJ family cysteine cluster protein [Rhodobacteraceae bacterium DSL-40]|uniref:YkgJ family cysteine cluster protein n=1 Tax=Amaricoccus sp. B4 TaxID=3368557 RepID=UPI000DACA04A